MSTPHVITLSAVNSSVFVSVTAYNDFGSGGASLAALDDISKSPTCTAYLQVYLGTYCVLHVQGILQLHAHSRRHYYVVVFMTNQ